MRQVQHKEPVIAPGSAIDLNPFDDRTIVDAAVAAQVKRDRGESSAIIKRANGLSDFGDLIGTPKQTCQVWTRATLQSSGANVLSQDTFIAVKNDSRIGNETKKHVDLVGLVGMKPHLRLDALRGFNVVGQISHLGTVDRCSKTSLNLMANIRHPCFLRQNSGYLGVYAIDGFFEIMRRQRSRVNRADQILVTGIR
ncbi:MAG: hypothetical protein AAGH43_07120 [Pseudomonadota bacterium]